MNDTKGSIRQSLQQLGARVRFAMFPRSSSRESAATWLLHRMRGISPRWLVRVPEASLPATAAERQAFPDPEVSPLAHSLMERFAALETSKNRHYFRALAVHLAGAHDDPCLAMYFNFALSANERGNRAAAIIESIVPLEGKRALDVGCAYGGFLVGLAARGAEPTGFDLDQSLLALGEHNFRDVGRRFPTHLADVTKTEDVAQFREQFDIITCNDVIEHVKDPAVAIEHICSMLRPGGLAYFEIPNRDEVSAVFADGHYQLFGITQLDREMARRYFEAHAPGIAYGVEYYLQLAEYRALFERVGMSMELLWDAGLARPVEAIHESLCELRRTLEAKLPGVPMNVRAEVEREVNRYLEEADSAPSASESDRHEYVNRYGVAFWRVIARKATNSPSPGTDLT